MKKIKYDSNSYYVVIVEKMYETGLIDVNLGGFSIDACSILRKLDKRNELISFDVFDDIASAEQSLLLNEEIYKKQGLLWEGE